jgi:S-adenosylmethionine:tRNA ribosyltransferase-isomerase
MSPTFRLGAFDYSLPEDRIALFPVEPRDSAALLLYDEGSIVHGYTYAQLPGILKERFPIQPPLLVFNDTKVFKARLWAHNTKGQKVEIFLLSPLEQDFSRALQSGSPSLWQVLIGRPARWKQGEMLTLCTDSVKLNLNREGFNVRLHWTPEKIPLLEVLETVAQVPLPPYIKRSPVPEDAQRYQTTYARETGSVAAPTAGLHFTESLLERLDHAGIVRCFVTLHVGAGTFAPVKDADDVRRHTMHAEFFSVKGEILEFLASWSGPVIPVGTTALRTLETLFWLAVQLIEKGDYTGELPQDYPYQIHQTAKSLTYREALETLAAYCRKEGLSHLSGATSLYIYPGYKIRSCDGLITNFHQPRSTLLMLVHALVGDDWKRIYQEALEGPVRYRFLSYGDGMLLLKPRNYMV